MAYNPADFELVDAPAGSAPPYNPADFDLVSEPEGSGFWRQAADLPVSAMGGVVTGLKGMSDVFGANNPVSQELGSYQQFYNQALSPEAQADQQEVARIMQEAQDKGMWEQIKAGGRAFATAPLDTMAQSLGTMAPIVATGVAGKAFGLGARGVQIAQAVAGSGMQAGTVKDEIYQNTKQFLMQRGKSEEEADRVALEAQSYGGQNLDQILLGAGLGALDAVSGVESILGKTISKTGREVTGGVIVNALKTGVKEAIPEALQGGQEPLAKNIALQRQGYDVPTMRGVLAQGTMEGLAGFAAGAPVGAAEGFGGGYDPERPVINVAPPAPAFVPPPAAATVDVQEAFGDPTTAAAEPAATQPAASSYNPDDFEPVVEEPSAPIVTEPPAAPRFRFDLADDTATAPEMDAAADVFSGLQGQAVEDASVTIFNYDEKVKPIQDQIDAKIDELETSGMTFEGANQDPSVLALYEKRHAMDRGAINSYRNIVNKAFSDQGITNDNLGFTPASSISHGIYGSPRRSDEGFISRVYETGQRAFSDDQATIKKLAEDIFKYRAENEGLDPAGLLGPNSGLGDAGKQARVDEARIAAETIHNQIKSSLVPVQEKAAIEDADKIANGMKMYASGLKESIDASINSIDSFAQGLVDKTVGTVKIGNIGAPAVDPFAGYRASLEKSKNRNRKNLNPNAPMPVQEKAAVPATKTAKDPAAMTASQINKELDALSEKDSKLLTELIDAGRGNELSSETLKGNNPLSERARQIFSRRMDLKSEVELRAGPNMSRLPTGRGFGPRATTTDAPAARSQRRIKNMTAQSGAIDLSIVEDLVEYGKTIYRAGMSFGKWADQMVKEFGQGIASFLKQAFDRIVQAYNDSPYSSESGAVSVGGDAAGRRRQRGLSAQEVEELDNGPKIRLYRAMQIIGGKLYPPMSALVDGGLRNPTEIGAWEVAEERPDLLDKNGKFVLNKGNKSTVPAAYNPYFHTSSSPLNDQFSSAYKRGNLVTVEVEVPASELTSGYRAEGAKDAVGEVRWNSGPVSSRLPEDRRRRVVLSRYAKVVRIVPDGEVAGTIAKLLDGTGIAIPENTVTPSLAEELEKSGVRIIRKAGIASALANPQSGGIDASVLADIVEFGKAIYQNGMTLGKWSAEMVAEFGQAVAKYLKEAFNRIVQAYKDSPYSDTTGAVGNVQPKMKPRQFEEKAKKSDAVTEEAKAELGSEYVPITLQGTAEQAKAWINQNGLDAAEQRILDLAADSLTPTPIDFGIGLEMAARLGAMGEHQRQARVVRIMSNRATSIGQTISVLAMLSRLTPEGIVFYANQIIEQHIDSLPEERQKPIRAAQESVISAEKETKQTRKTVAEDTIINGTQGGEKIQEKLKRRIKDKAQKQRTNVGIRSVLTSEATKAEATKQIAQLLTESGISESEAGALSTAITSRFYKVLDKSRRAIATRRYPKEPKLIKIWSKLVAKLNGEGMSDADFVAGLSLVSKLPTMTPELGARLKDLTRQLRDAKGDEDMQLVIAGRIFEEVHSLVPVDFWIKVRAFSYLMMLFSPKTWIRNIGGNTIQWVANAGMDTALNIVGGRVGILSNGKTGDRLRGGRLKSLLTPVWDIKRGMEWNAGQNPQANFGKNLLAGIDHLRLLSKLTTQNKFEIADAKEVGRRVFSSKFMNMLDTSLSIALGAPDRAFWKSALEASLNNREAIAIQMGEWTGRHTPEDVDGAYADAAAAIYQNANTISRESAKLRSSLNRGSTKLLSYFLPGVKPTDQFGFGTALMAFTQVPGAIVRSSINWSPLGIITNLSQAMNGILWKASNQRAGKPFNQQEFAKAFTRALGGTGIYVAGYYLYAMGIITASQEDDDDVEAMRKASGMGQYRINVTALKRLLGTMAWGTPQKAEDGDQILSYDWAQPLAITFAAGAELAKMVEQNDRNGIKKGLAAKAAMPAISLAAGAKSLLELPLLSGLSSFIDQIDTKRPETVVSAVSRTVMGMPSMFVPQLLRQAAQLSDNTARETRGGNASSAIPVTVQRAFNQIAANTPGVTDQFPPRMDVMGIAQERYQYKSNHWFNVLINPALTSQVKINPALQEVERLMQTTGETSQFPRAVSRMADINGKKIDLTNDQISAYQYYLGNYTMSMFNWRMASPKYARLPDIEKVKLLAQDLEDVNASTKSYLFGHDVQRLTRRQRSMRANLANSPLGQSMPPR